MLGFSYYSMWDFKNLSQPFFPFSLSFSFNSENISERWKKKSNETFHKQYCYQNWRDTKYIMKNRLFSLTSILLPYIFPDILLVWAKGVREILFFIYTFFFLPEKKKTSDFFTVGDVVKKTITSSLS